MISANIFILKKKSSFCLFLVYISYRFLFLRGSLPENVFRLRILVLLSVRFLPESFFPFVRIFAEPFPRPILYRLPGTDKAVFVKSDQIRSAGFGQSLMNKLIILRIAVLYQCSLHGFFMGISTHVHRLHVPWIQPRIVHHRG